MMEYDHQCKLDPTIPLKYPYTLSSTNLATLVIINLCPAMMSQCGDITPHHLAAQLRANEAMIMETARHIDDMQALMADCCWRESMAHDNLDEAFSIGDFHTLLERMSVMRSDFQ
jgi:hypothetical protein